MRDFRGIAGSYFGGESTHLSRGFPPKPLAGGKWERASAIIAVGLLWIENRFSQWPCMLDKTLMTNARSCQAPAHPPNKPTFWTSRVAEKSKSKRGRMSQTRSTKGCWTCKLRKKKCDEGKPACYACHSLRLDCSGYGPRPDWMDDGPKEKQRLGHIREIVKETTRQKKRVAMLQRQIKALPLEDQVLVRPGQLDLQVPLPSTLDVPRPISQAEADRVNSLPKLIDGPPAGLQPGNAASYVAQNETVLLMHYLDHVFPLQFRFYESSLEEGGRGWLLTLLLECKPLYHAACSLAAYHRQVTYCLREGMMKPCFTGEALNGQYDKAISELRRFLENLVLSDRERSLSEELRLLCSIVIFISIEVSISSSPSLYCTHIIRIDPGLY